MKDFRRLALYFALAVTGVLLWNAWEKDHPPAAVQPQTQAQMTPAASKTQSGDYVPQTFTPSSTPATRKTTPTQSTSHIPQGKMVRVKTDVLNVAINLNGGTLAKALLPKYPKTLKNPDQYVQILNPNPAATYIAQSGLTDAGKPIRFTAARSSYQLQEGQKQLDVVLTGNTSNGLKVTKTFVFKRDHYGVDVKFNIKNASTATWKGGIYHQITRKNVPQKTSFHSRSYSGASYGSPKKPYEKLSFKTMKEQNLSKNVQGGWVAMQQQYFLSTWVPEQSTSNHFYTHASQGSNNQGLFTIGFVSPQMSLAPGASAKSQAAFYVGPELGKRLSALAKGLDLTIDYGWLWPISKLVFWVMALIHSLVGNWGWSIVLVTLLIKLVFYPLSNKSYVSMAKMRELAPRMKQLKERYADDKQAMSKATMEMYKKEKVNPMGGCLPMIIQIPVFIALYYVLIEAVQLRQAPFIFWIHDLSVKDPYYVLPILMGLSMFVQQKLSPPPPDPTQAKVMMFLPIVFTIFFISFPAGLVLYWLTNNILSVLQQWYVMKKFDPKAQKSKKKR